MATTDHTPTPLPGATYRFVVNSAEEAVRMIHQKLGADARVTSVKQIGARGFAGLLRAPQLEVIAEITPAASAGPTPVAASPTAAPHEDESTWLQSAPTPSAAALTVTEPLERLLSRAGIGEQTLARWRGLPSWDQLCARPLGESLKEVVEMLRTQWHEKTPQPLGTRMAFFGPPGSGSTTALCKALTIDVFFRQQPAVVMKLDGDQPNSTEGLAMFCEALDVPLLRSADELEDVPDGLRFYFDATGSPLHDAAAWRDLGRLLSEFYIETRVLVLNAAYEIELLKRAYTLGREAGATHVVFTHLDEVQHWGKLWDLLLGGGLQPMFFSCGQNVSGDLRENTFGLMVQRMLGGLNL
ncbi:MAG: flagellar biosynthesis protein FlhF [Chthoniobacter sp.]|jgi:flagellar biosynthesis protein FlhF|nr:flagellar biosynthesis protein FlhF [Chthoniobacter sp.]